ncbi:MAG: histidinol-phosphate transaminase [Rhodoferax sp.]|nr:histidinol-phosphate transaminase [Rhodoferax sp.]
MNLPLAPNTAPLTAEDLVARRIRADVQAMHAYGVQDPQGMVKLDAMENPFRLSPALQSALGARLGAVAINRYPGMRVQTLRQALAQYADLPAGYDLILGNGSDELISLLSLACAVGTDRVTGKPPVVLAPVPGFVMYAMSAQLQGLDFVGVPLTPDFALDVPAMLAAIARTQPAIVYLAYPNNPTANLWDASDMAQVVAAAAQSGSLVVLDEAYQPFSSRSYLDTLRAQPQAHTHVLLMRTLSKFGLAGVRLGYLMGPQALVAELDKVRPPYNISALNCECALFALEHADAFDAQAQAICSERTRLLQALRQLPGLRVWDSDANMILVRVPAPAADDAAQAVFESLRARGVLVKNVSKMHPLLANCLRLTVGNADENNQLLSALQASL